MPQEVARDPKLRAILGPIFDWCGVVGRYLDKLGVEADDSLTNDLARDAAVDVAIDSQAGIEEMRAFDGPPRDLASSEANSQRVLAGVVMDHTRALPPPGPADAQAVLASRIFGGTR